MMHSDKSYSRLRSVRQNFIDSRSRWPSLRRARARAWMSCWGYHEELRRMNPQWWRPPYDHLHVTNGSVTIRCTALDPDTMHFEMGYEPGEPHPASYIIGRLEGAELRRLARWLYAGTLAAG